MEKNIVKLVEELCKLAAETEYVEFKYNNCDPEMIGCDISALANSAAITDRSHSYMIWGVDDKSHAIIGTEVRLRTQKKGGEELESWLRRLLSDNADFEISSAEIGGKHLEVLIIRKAEGLPVSFMKQQYVRIGSYTKKIADYPAKQMMLLTKLRDLDFESNVSLTGLSLADILRLLNVEAYFRLLNIPRPYDSAGCVRYLEQDNLVRFQDDGLYAITNLGAILFAINLDTFPRLGRKKVRVVQYEGNNRLAILRQDELADGYAISLARAFEILTHILPVKEDINKIRLTTVGDYPLPAIREAIANALIHQDFYVTGAGPLIEVFDSRVEVTNPGTPLVDIKRIVDNPPRSRNEGVSSLMRRMGLCEELGRGWDKMVISCELMRSSSPMIQIYGEATRVTLYSRTDYTRMTQEERLWSLYLHACIRYVEGESLTNSSLRERFGLAETLAGSMSRLIKEALSRGLIQPKNPSAAYRYMEYIPKWT